MTEEPQRKMLGDFEILAELGRGGFATVYLAVDTTLERQVALKVLHPALHSDPTFTQRFRREAKALASLSHPHVIVIYRVGEAEGRIYIAMELADGASLDRRIAENGALPWKETLEIMEQVCGALGHAHQAGIVHRDLKPSNVLLDRDRGVLLSDFGLARLIGAASAGLSASQGILGTPAYIAPELWELDAAGPASDIYSLGCIVFEMLTGQTLFTGATPMQVMRAHDKGPLLPRDWPKEIPPGIETVLGKALARDPKERYASAEEFWQALNGLDFGPRQEQAEQAAAGYRTEVEQAIAAGQWSAAQMAVEQWQARLPGDAEAVDAGERVQAAMKQALREAEERARQREAIEQARRREADERARRLQEQKESVRPEPRIEAHRRTATVSPIPTGQTPADSPGSTAGKARKPMSNRAIMILAGTGIVITMLCCYGVYSFFQPTPADIAALETNTAQYATETAAVLVGPATIVLPATGDTTATPPPAIPPPLITATPWQTATPVTDDPLEFMRHYYDVIVSHGCRRAYGMLSDRYKDTFPVENRYIQYETWCQSFAKIDLIEKETLSNDGHSAAVRIVVQWTQNNGRVINTRPMKVELVRDDSGKVWLIDSSVFTE